MDDLLAKLRAAKPEARDQRDRRRRARLKDRHAVRVASGQKMQDMATLVKGGETIEAGLMSPMSEVSNEGLGEDGDMPPEQLNDEDVAERAASMLEGLKGEGSAGNDEDDERIPLPREDSIRIRRRRESAQDERAARRRRRQQAQSASETSLGHPTIAEEAENEDGESEDKRHSLVSGGSAEVESEDGERRPDITTPVTVVHPPSPEHEKHALPTPPQEHGGEDGE